MTIISEIQIEGFCKKVKNKPVYAYSETPASIYRLAKTGDDQWKDYPELKAQWDDKMRAIKVAKDWYENKNS